MDKEVKIGSIIEFESGNRYKVIKVFPGNVVDLQDIVSPFESMPDYRGTYFSIQLVNFKIIE